MSISLLPQPGYIVASRAPEEPAPGGIYIPEGMREKPQRGTVLAVWDPAAPLGRNDPPLRLAVGDVILFRKYGPSEIELDGVTYILLEQADVYAIVQNAVAE